ncbi:low molecular weight protein-tyrosine-phosphatase [Fulvimonas soli]|jgi:protein-tyrosine phosphatase|uniref:protein-tyrosine-phosphatase n=1 Tax=Fulvimonas soli TaxID=155197 RepID=A0A316IAP8_9GAMM|nr:low molecular weight protein-tyrosine-phosphatase [Fulvimonas soli]PWK89866.1 protein tyrosine phosphatase [Fulvimonas soli]TNY27497.1 phosphotyrosine protein phosphatase [Fulvimonas soli]
MVRPNSILFVCLGNICRSPLVEAVARHHLRAAGLDVAVASCGTGDWHVGEGADPRMVAAAGAAGYDLAVHRARQLRPDDFGRHDLLLAMDRANLRELRRLAPAAAAAGTALFLEWSGLAAPPEFPDPYFGDTAGFAESVALAERGVAALLQRLRGD